MFLSHERGMGFFYDLTLWIAYHGSPSARQPPAWAAVALPFIASSRPAFSCASSMAFGPRGSPSNPSRAMNPRLPTSMPKKPVPPSAFPDPRNTSPLSIMSSLPGATPKWVRRPLDTLHAGEQVVLRSPLFCRPCLQVRVVDKERGMVTGWHELLEDDVTVPGEWCGEGG